MTVPTEHLLILAGILFAIGVAGIFLRRNLIVVLMSIELMLNAANITFLAGSRQHSTAHDLNLDGPIFAIFVIAVAAVEAAVGLAILIAFFRHKATLDIQAATELKG